MNCLQVSFFSREFEKAAIVRVYGQDNQPGVMDRVVDTIAKGALHSFKGMMGTLVGDNLNVDYIAENSPRDTFHALLSNGYHPASLPRAMGGCHDYSMLDLWIRRRISVDEIMSGAACPVKSSELANQVVVKKEQQQQQRGPSPLNTTTKKTRMVTLQLGETEEEFHRRRSNIYSKRCRANQFHKVEQLVQDKYRLKERNRELQAENEQLQQLLNKAKAYVEQQREEEYERRVRVMDGDEAFLSHHDDELYFAAHKIFSDDLDLMPAEMLLIDDGDDDDDDDGYDIIFATVKDDLLPPMDGDDTSPNHDELYSTARPREISFGNKDDSDLIHEAKIPLIDDDEILAALQDEDYLCLN